MSRRIVVSVATTDHTRKGQARLAAALQDHDCWCATTLHPGWPKHSDKPYAFKAYAIVEALGVSGADAFLWCDACILPVRSLEPAWEKIERDGYLLMNNGFSNYEWTADSAYPDLFPGEDIKIARAINRCIPHTVGGFFGMSMKHENGRAFLAELYRLASETRAFCGPWVNTAWAGPGLEATVNACGPPDVRGHRHDQTAMSVIARRLRMRLTDCPEFLVYGKPETAQDERTLVVADGSHA